MRGERGEVRGQDKTGEDITGQKRREEEWMLCIDVSDQ
jgi:hypothetical protein